MRFKKILSVFLAALMIFSVTSLGLTGVAAEINYDAQYRMLAAALKNEHVRELTNYTVTNNTLNNGTGGFDSDARGFAYDHKVVAQDNISGDILVASNRFYYIAETLLSYTYGVGCYNAEVLIEYISDRIMPYFNSDTDAIYEDFFGSRYYPTAEEIDAYNAAVEEILAAGLEVDKINLPTYGIEFIEKNSWEYYNVATVLRYFMGNTLKINTGNWYHRFSFVVETSINVALEGCRGVNNIGNGIITLRTAAYQFEYERFYNESMSKSYFAFKQPSLDTVWQTYGSEYDFDRTPADLTVAVDDVPGILFGGQASAYLIKVEYDGGIDPDTGEAIGTVQKLSDAYAAFMRFINQEAVLGAKYTRWDEPFINMTDAQISNPTAVAAALGRANETSKVKGWLDEVKAAGDYLFSTFSNDALVALFGDDLGNMITLYYLLKPISSNPPERVVRGASKYTATPEALTNIINDIDALIYTQEGDTEHAGIANRVVSIIKPLLDIGGLLGVEGELEYETLGELVTLVVNELVFTDSIVNMLVKLVYPMIADLLVDLLGGLTDSNFINNTVSTLLNNVITDNKLAIYPNKLGELLDTDSDTKGKYGSAAAILKAAGDNWENVNFDELSWGVDAAPTSQKADAFLDALCAGLGGFTRLLVVVFCGGSSAEGGDQSALQDKDNFGRYFDLELIPLVGGWIASQGLYTKLFIPLFRVLGLEEGKDFMTTLQFHTSIVNSNGIFLKNCLRNVLKPIITFVTDYVAKRPIETVMKLVPNLTHFLSRTGTGDYKGYLDDWTDDGFGEGFLGDRQKVMHNGYATLQTENLLTILDNFHIFISVVGSGIYIGSIASLIGGGTLDMLSSLNSLLNELISFAYDTGGIASENPVCYSQWDQVSSIYLYEGPVVLPDSEEYLENPAAYPTPHTRYYYNPEDETDISLYATGTHTEIKQDLVYAEKDFYIPAIPEGKLISCGTIDSATNTIKVEYPGQVFLFLLRYALSALGYRYNTKDKSLPTLIECLGLELDSELFLGLSLEDIINNVMIHPDEAICALLELFYSGETGDLYLGKEYSYPPDRIDYRNDALLSKSNNPTLSYGVEVEYSQYWTRENANQFIESLGPLAEDILVMLGLEGVEDGLGPFLRGFIEDSLFTDDLINTVFNLIYQLLAGLKDSLGMDIAPIADAALGIKFDPATISEILIAMVGETPAAMRIAELNDWAELFSAPVIDPDTCRPTLDEEGNIVLDEEGNPIPDLSTGTPMKDEEGNIITEFQDVELDWGTGDSSKYNLAKGELFLKTLASLLSPAGFLIKFLFMDQDLSILGLINLPGYAGYEYAFIGLLEALSCPGILTYREYYEKSASINPLTNEENICGDANSIYYLFAPLLSLLEKVYADPVTTVLSMIPNLLFFISIGGFNGLVNNLVHFAYVLLDILKPIINGYDLVNNLLANLEIEGLTISLTIPLDVDFNALVSDLLGSLLGDTLTIEGVALHLPYIDLYSLCVGTVEAFPTKEQRSETVHLNSAGGGDLLTALLRIVCQVLFMDENHKALSQIVANLAEEGRLDAYDEETLYIVIDGLFDLLEEYKVIDIVLMAIYLLVTNVLPIADMLAPKFQEKGMTIGDLIDVIDDPALFIETLMKLIGDEEVEVPGEVTDGEAAMSLLDKLKAFFEKIKLFFLKLFPFFA